MKTTRRLKKLAPTLCLIAGLAAFGSAFAQDGGVVITNAVYQQVEVKAADGTVHKELAPVSRVVPGDEVIYELSYRNNGSQPATGVQINNPVSPELVFVQASVPPTMVSVDGGKTFGVLSELKVNGDDGVERPAQASDITNVRWILSTLEPGASGKVVYRARVR
jgi:uncharacterized repeat protein (TIGR01451 family)